MAELSPSERTGLVAAWEELREAVQELAAVDPERARLYLASASCSLRSWTHALRVQRPGPSRLRERQQ